MAYNNNNQYSGYGGNPYGDGDNPYGTEGYGQANPYAQSYSDQQPLQPPAPTRQGESNYSAMTQDSQYSTPQAAGVPANGVPAAQAGGMATGSQAPMQQAAPTVLSNQDFLARVEAAKADIRQLTQYISEIASAHQRTLNSPDASTNQALESIVTQTQVLNTSIKDQIKFLETDAARSGRNNNIKNSQVGQLKTSFKKQLEEYRNEEASYERRYREQIARQYRIVNPEATDAEVQEASNADWGNEGVFQTALKTNRSATASTVLGAVRARHNDIQQIERTLIELNKLFEDLAEAVVIQEPMIQQAEQHTENVKKDTEAGNVQLDKGITHARRARRLKWWCLLITIIILIIVGLAVGIPLGLQARNNNNNNGA
ncbi:t-SNARE [Aureobasidium pullulans]|uniref:t-SNARE n=1 Tax=Aureobasidium pullulans TaxID=5580 RepID=A0A4S8TEI0_AURPU|nr:t-SNARE [Aureobasidium pullulans]THV82696.1 t-SNARE [Aureobasidium pullulans]THW17618.1 t-SNARE [Aureobasidium pullulans]THW57835.1 t-SNARE [Aureobasidium pullulans]THW73794.1 t-SNARE [Aureobasidium pullulans]